MISKPDELIGVGLYTPREAALYARLNTQTFNRWFYGDSRYEPVTSPQKGEIEGERVVTFWDLIQAVGIRNLRLQTRSSSIPLQRIRNVLNEARKEFGLEFPLARRHTIYIYSNRLILKHNDDWIGLTRGIDRHQLYSHKLIEHYLEELKYDDEGMADEWTPLSSSKYRVSLNADRRFGAPTIEPGGILVESLADSIESEGSVDAAAEAFEVEREAVVLAQKYVYDYLGAA